MVDCSPPPGGYIGVSIALSVFLCSSVPLRFETVGSEQLEILKRRVLRPEDANRKPQTAASALRLEDANRG